MNTPLPSGPRGPREPGPVVKVVFGLGLTLFGLALLANNLGWFDLRHLVSRFWPMLLILAGIAILVQRRHRSSLWGFFLLFWGLWILADQLNVIRVNFWAVFGPALLVMIGGTLIWRAVSSSQNRDATTTPDAYIRTYALLSGSELQPQSAVFKGAELTAAMGGVKLDLKTAQLEEGSVPIIDVFALMGGIEIHVPRDWEVVNQVTALMGACADKRRPATVQSGKRIMVRGMAILGGIEIKD
jgi:predicted membrane protein